MATIKARILKASRVLKVYRENHTTYKNSPQEPDEQAITDLIADLMHLVKKLGKDPAWAVSMAKDHFDAEHKHEDEPGKHPWTVIGQYHEDGGQITADGVNAVDGFGAIMGAIKERKENGEEYGFHPVCAIPGETLGIIYAEDLTEDQQRALEAAKEGA